MNIYKKHVGNKMLIVRPAIENKKQWVYEIVYDGRNYAQVISGRFKTKTQAVIFGINYANTGETKYLEQVR